MRELIPLLWDFASADESIPWYIQPDYRHRQLRESTGRDLKETECELYRDYESEYVQCVH